MQQVQAWEGIICNPLGFRSEKPRNNGITMVIDKGLGIRETQDLLETASNFFDFLKLGFGTSAFYSEDFLREKIKLCKKFAVTIYPGGTFLEVAIIQNKFECFLHRAAELGIDTLEISDGTISLEPLQRKKLIFKAASLGFKVLTEVGKKDPKETVLIKELFNQAEEDLSAGAWKVIMEGRESGKSIGIYDKEGNIIEDKFLEFTENNNQLNNIIWEAPLKNQQIEFITRFGPDVNLGNILPEEILALEALRAGLRGDTLKLVLEATGKRSVQLTEQGNYSKLFSYIPAEFLAAASK